MAKRTPKKPARPFDTAQAHRRTLARLERIAERLTDIEKVLVQVFGFKPDGTHLLSCESSPTRVDAPCTCGSVPSRPPNQN